MIATVINVILILLGSALGAIAGYFGGWVDSIIMRALDIFMSVPDILFTMSVVVALGASAANLILALTLAYFSNYVRLYREGKEKYEKQYGPLQQANTAAGGSYAWLSDPWPWDVEGGKA